MTDSRSRENTVRESAPALGVCIWGQSVDVLKTGWTVLAATLLLGGCSFGGDTLWPSLTGDEPTESAERIPVPPSPSEANTQPLLRQAGSGQTPAPLPPSSGLAPAPTLSGVAGASPTLAGTPTGTFVGQKTAELRGELQRLNGQLSQQNSQLQQIRQNTTINAQRYHGTVAAITARLQLGTTPGNPILVNQWNAAQAELERVGADIGNLNTLANQIAGNSALAAYVLESARAAYSLSGAVDEDHRQLAILEDETNRTVVLIDRLLSEINEDVARQTAYVANERSNLTTLSAAIKNGELNGPSLLTRAYTSSAGNQPVSFGTSATPRSGFSAGGRSPLVVIRFDRPDVPYRQALYTAVSKTLEARPNALFDLVAVAPGSGSNSQVALEQSRLKKHTNDVLKALVDMGLPASRVSLGASQNPGASSSEVHLYVR